jgi:DNA invertase Pin-like site-specific DNA recombinase
MKIGYARVSTTNQNLDTQLKLLNIEGVDKVFEEKISGVTTKRPELQKLLEQLRKDDIVVVTALSRLSRKTIDCLELISIIQEKGASFKCLDFPALDTTTDSGKLFFTIYAAIKQYERDDIVTRTRYGQRLAKENGKHIGRSVGLDPDRMEKITTLLSKGFSISEIVKLTGISKSTVIRYRKQID